MRKPRLVRWSIVCSDKGKSSLGVKNLSLLNKTLLYKWNWFFAVKWKALWKQVICGKYEKKEGGWRSYEVKERYGVGLWKAIKKY